MQQTHNRLNINITNDTTLNKDTNSELAPPSMEENNLGTLHKVRGLIQQLSNFPRIHATSLCPPDLIAQAEPFPFFDREEIQIACLFNPN